MNVEIPLGGLVYRSRTAQQSEREDVRVVNPFEVDPIIKV